MHIDAHTDTFDNLDHFLGARDSAAHWASFCVREGLINAETSIQVGLRAILEHWTGLNLVMI